MSETKRAPTSEQWSWLRVAFSIIAGMGIAEYRGHSMIGFSACLFGLAALAAINFVWLIWIIIAFSIKWQRRDRDAR